MRHARGYRRLNRTHEHRKALFANMAGSLIEHEQIKTTLPKAKELRPIIEKLITLAKRGDLHARRQAAAQLKQDQYVTRLFDILGPRYKDRQGGYCRITKLGARMSDSAPMAFIGWTGNGVRYQSPVAIITAPNPSSTPPGSRAMPSLRSTVTPA